MAKWVSRFLVGGNPGKIKILLITSIVHTVKNVVKADVKNIMSPSDEERIAKDRVENRMAI